MPQFNPNQLPSGVYNNGDPVVAVKPLAPTQMSVQLLGDNITYRLRVATLAYSIQNSRGVSLSQKIRVYFTPVTSVNPDSLRTTVDIARAFSKAYILEEFSAPQQGGISFRTYNAQTLGDGLFWATVVNPATYGRMESGPAGPAFIDTGAEARLISSVVPPDVGTVAGFIPPAVNIFVPTGQTLKYATITCTYAPPTPNRGSFDGIEIWMSGYFSNFTFGLGPNPEECGFYKFVGTTPPAPAHPRGGQVTFTILCDYDSTAAPPLSSPHDVKIYMVAASEGRTIQLPVTSRPAVFDFPNGIGT